MVQAATLQNPQEIHLCRCTAATWTRGLVVHDGACQVSTVLSEKTIETVPKITGNTGNLDHNQDFWKESRRSCKEPHFLETVARWATGWGLVCTSGMPSSNCVARKNHRNSAKNHRKHWECRSKSRFLERIKAKLRRTPFFRDGCKVGHRLGIGVHIENAKLQLCCPKKSSKQCQKSPETLGMSIKIKISGANSGRSGCNECAHLRPRPRRPRTCA